MLASAARVARAWVDTRAALSEPSSSSTTPRGVRGSSRGASSTGSRRGGARGGGRAPRPRGGTTRGGGRDWPSVTLATERDVRFPRRRHALLQPSAGEIPGGRGLARRGETHAVLLDALGRHPDARDKMGDGVATFRVSLHPTAGYRSFAATRVDGTAVDFSLRKCVDAMFGVDAKREIPPPRSPPPYREPNRRKDARPRRAPRGRVRPHTRRGRDAQTRAVGRGTTRQGGTTRPGGTTRRAHPRGRARATTRGGERLSKSHVTCATRASSTRGRTPASSTRRRRRGRRGER